MIQAYLLIMGLDDEDDYHGRRFCFYMRYIYNISGTNIKLQHKFYTEAEPLRCNWWQCDGPCGQLKNRATNRTQDIKAHKRKCAGNFVKIAEPEKPPGSLRKLTFPIPLETKESVVICK
ncbi:hypothetical protein XELAEV_18012401mg [Xenopus laevis]|uniref:Uncharacterized protein n=1 Tax=Xenopus laevis TaxID=8355 RepID=A0A974HYB9_XENLA|nr:hypothetical protein XELAEV_18012401mg [Xenopus laevis]